MGRKIMPRNDSSGETTNVRLSFVNTDAKLREAAEAVAARRSRDGIDQLVGGLECCIINTEPDRQNAALGELTARTGYSLQDAFATLDRRWAVLSFPGSADLVVTSRLSGPNPFACPPDYPVCVVRPDARLETFVYRCHDLRTYVEVQKARGVEFLTPDPVELEEGLFIQTTPSTYTRNSTGFVEWTGGRRHYRTTGAMAWDPAVQADGITACRQHVKHLDHAATRVQAEHRDPAILEFMSLTGYSFDFAVYVDELNSITNVARHPEDPFALVFTSGVSPFVSPDESGPTERFVYRYGPRTHHLAFHTENIDTVYQAMVEAGVEFLVDLVGGEDQGLKQTFTGGSPSTLLVNEYIYRYGDFDGFFTRHNVAVLTEATGRQ